MSQYLLSVHRVDGEATASDDATQQAFVDVEAFTSELQSSGAWVFAGGLQPADMATVVAVDGPEVMTTDGPFAESTEHVGRFWIIDVSDLDAALAWAAKGAKACRGPVEVRPLQDG